jgi:hypothetical protein
MSILMIGGWVDGEWGYKTGRGHPPTVGKMLELGETNEGSKEGGSSNYYY